MVNAMNQFITWWNDFFNTDFLLMTESLLRIILVMLCGGFIGYERKSRGKDAGIRTHMIVALASCLMMLISQYGFQDLYAYYENSGIKVQTDPARIAAQIIPGIGFLGAGMTFLHKKTVTGLTTAAGIWATAGIGMTIGCGMYFLGITSTLLIVFVQIMLHKHLHIFHIPLEKEFTFTIRDTQEEIAYVLDALKMFDLSVAHFSFQRKSDGSLEMQVLAHCPNEINHSELIQKLYENPNVYAAQ